MGALVSVIVPVYNGRAYIGAALESLRAQTYADWEALVVDDGSTDGSAEIVRGFGRGDARIALHQQANRGLPAARNAGIRRAGGEFVAFLDADDLWLPHKLERQVDAWAEGVLYSDAYLMPGDRPGSERIGDHIRFARGQIFGSLLEENIVPVLTAFFSRELVERAGCFDETLVLGCEDYDLWLRLATDDVPFDFIQEPLAAYRVHAQAMSLNSVNMGAARLAVYEKLAAASRPGRRALVEQRAARERRDLAGTLRQRAWKRALEGALDGAREDLRAAQATAATAAGGLVTAVATRSDIALRALARWRVATPHRSS